MKKILSIIGTIALCGTTSVNLVACGITKQVFALNTVITNPNLNEISVGKLNQPTEEQIKKALKAKYSSLNTTKINVQNIKPKTAEITSADTNIYTGTVIVNYTSKQDFEFQVVKDWNEDNGMVQSLATSVIDRSIYVGTGNGLYKSIDGGVTFNPVIGMEKWIKSLIISIDGTVYAGTFELINNVDSSKVYKKALLDPEFKPIEGTMGMIKSLAIGTDGTIYAGAITVWGDQGNLYEKKLKDTEFKVVRGWNENNGAIRKLIVASNGTVYAGTATTWPANNVVDIKGNMYEKKLSDTEFQEVRGWNEDNGAVESLVVDTDGTEYAGTVTGKARGKLYQKKKDENVFEDITKTIITGSVTSLTIDLNRTIYFGTWTTWSANAKGKLYEKKVNDTGFKEVKGWNENNGAVESLVVNTDGTVYAGTVWGDKGKLFKNKN